MLLQCLQLVLAFLLVCFFKNTIFIIISFLKVKPTDQFIDIELIATDLVRFNNVFPGDRGMIESKIQVEIDICIYERGIELAQIVSTILFEGINRAHYYR